jgi:hypothetical protein
MNLKNLTIIFLTLISTAALATPSSSYIPAVLEHEYARPDGTIVRTYSTGTKIIIYPDSRTKLPDTIAELELELLKAHMSNDETRIGAIKSWLARNNKTVSPWFRNLWIRIRNEDI